MLYASFFKVEDVLEVCLDGVSSTNGRTQSMESSGASASHRNEGILGSLMGIMLVANVVLIVLLLTKIQKKEKRSLPLQHDNSFDQYVLFVYK